MPHIIVVADGDTDRSEGAVMLRERINVGDLASDHFANYLLERLEWAVGDAREAELNPDEVEETSHGRHPRPTRGADQRSASVVTTAS